MHFFLEIIAVVCVFCFFVGLIFCTGAGEYWLKMFDSFAGTIGLVVIALMEMIAVIYIYGHERYRQSFSKSFQQYKPFVRRFTEDIFQMTGYRPGLYWQMTWRYIGPAIMGCILVSSVLFMIIENPTYSAWNAEEVLSRLFFFLT